MDIVQRLKSVLKANYIRLNVIFIAFFLLAILAIIANQSFHYTLALSPRTLRGLGKTAGGVAGNFALLAVIYVAVRELLIAHARQKLTLPAKTVKFIKQFTSILRMLHPLTGLASLTFAVLHGYLLWLWPPLFNAVMQSGMVLLISSLAAGTLGMSILVYPAVVWLRRWHRLAGFILIVFYIAHMLL